MRTDYASDAKPVYGLASDRAYTGLAKCLAIKHIRKRRAIHKAPGMRSL